jgi:hypothetical protein
MMSHLVHDNPFVAPVEPSLEPDVGALRPRITMMRVAVSRIAFLFSSLLGLGINLVYR